MSSLADFLAFDTPVEAAPAPQAWPPRIEHLSASSIGMFRRCPEQFRHRYVLGEKERPGEALVIGSMFHKTIEENYRTKIESHEDRPLAEMVQFHNDVSVPTVVEQEGGLEEIAWDGADPAKGLEVARRDSERIFAAYFGQVVPRIQPISVERKFVLDVPGMRVPLLGYLDTETNDDRVIDTKTGKTSVSKLKPSWMIQSTIYSAATGFDVEYHSISRAARPKIVTGLEAPGLIMRPSLAQAINVFRTATMVAQTIEHFYNTYGPDETWPTFGRFADWSMTFSPCTNCGWRKVCPAMEGEV